jgi:uncharacterized membrane protein
MFIEVGSMIGTMMVGNVFFVIIPAHWELIRAKRAGREPDPAPGIKAKLRSVHNNYLTLPVLLAMLSNHFPFVYGHDDAWLVLCAFVVLGAYIRHFFNLRHAGRTRWSMPVVAAAAVLALALWLAPPDTSTAPAGTADIAAGKQIFLTAGCSGCHTLEDAGASGHVGPNLDAARPSRALVINRVTNGQGVMPPFAGKLSPAQIEQVADYVSARAGA